MIFFRLIILANFFRLIILTDFLKLFFFCFDFFDQLFYFMIFLKINYFDFLSSYYFNLLVFFLIH